MKRRAADREDNILRPGPAGAQARLASRVAGAVVNRYQRRVIYEVHPVGTLKP